VLEEWLISSADVIGVYALPGFHYYGNGAPNKSLQAKIVYGYCRKRILTQFNGFLPVTPTEPTTLAVVCDQCSAQS
jgi:hypothetical protein